MFGVSAIHGFTLPFYHFSRSYFFKSCESYRFVLKHYNTVFKDNSMGKIFCFCGECELTVASDSALGSYLCGCQDCRQAAQWAEFKGGQKAKILQKDIYVLSDIIDVKGLQHMKAYLLRAGGLSTRVYCNLCYSILGIDFPAYNDTRFMFLEGHCITDLDISMNPVLAINMVDFPKGKTPDLPQGIKIVSSIHDPDKSWTQLPKVKRIRETFPSNRGKRFSQLLNEIGPPKILELEPGLMPK